MSCQLLSVQRGNLQMYLFHNMTVNFFSLFFFFFFKLPYVQEAVRQSIVSFIALQQHRLKGLKMSWFP